MSIHERLLLVDFDGVIADTFELALAAARVQTPELDAEVYRGFFRGNIYDNADKGAGLVKEGKPHEDDPYFREYVPRLMAQDPVPGMPEALAVLAKEFRMAIVSSTVNAPIARYLTTHGLLHHFELVYGSDTHKSKVVKIGMAMEKFGYGPHQCLFITDTVGDIKEATKAGVRAVAVDWGFHSREELAAQSPLAVVSSPDTLVREIHSAFAEGVA